MSNFKIKKYIPFYNRLLVTADRIQIKNIDGTIVDTSELKPYQTIISTGNTCNKDLKIGDVVMIVPDRYKKQRYTDSKIQGTSHLQQNIEYHFEFNIVTVDDIDYLEIFDGDIKAIIEVEECEPSMILTTSLGLDKNKDYKKSKLDPSGLMN